MVDYYQPNNITNIESENILQAEYLSAANHLISVNTVKNFNASNLISAIKTLENIDFIVCDNLNTNDRAKVFVDFCQFTNNNSIFIIKNIHSCIESKANWQFIQNQLSVTATVDLFHLGIVLFNQDFKVKQHFKVRF
jgi:hypothetical protein